MTRVRLDQIVFDAGTQIRAAIDQQVVADYAEAMTNGASFPPIVLFHDGNQHYLADGFHRFMAAQRNHLMEIPADVRAGTKDDALWFALGANKENGHRMTDADMRHAVELAFSQWPDRSPAVIAAQAGCSRSTAMRVKQHVVQMNTLPEHVIGKDGKTYPASRKAVESDPRLTTIASMVKQGHTNDEIIETIGANRHDLIARVRRDLGLNVADRSKAAVAKRAQEIAEMAERGYSTRQISDHLGVSTETVAAVAKRDGVVIHADRVIGKSKRHDANRIVEQMVMDADNLTADVNLIEFDDLNRSDIAGWLASLKSSRDKLGAFIRRLQEMQKHGEAA